MSSSDQIPIHENWCLSVRVVRFSVGYLGLGNENVYSSHSFLIYFAQLSFVYALVVSCA